MSDTYAGDISPKEAWDQLAASPNGVLIDVRTSAEWSWVGQVDLSKIEKEHLLIEWVSFPGSVPNAAFVDQVQAAVQDTSAPIYLLCRSGVRSKYAAIALTAAGFETCYNVAGGFEGDHDEQRHRGQTNGWKVAGLPWMQG